MFDLVILDLNMPISDGFDACKKISQLYESAKFFQNRHSNKDAQSSKL